MPDYEILEISKFVPGDSIQFFDENKPRKVVLPHADVHTPKDANGKAVRDTHGKIVTIKRERSWLESCSDSSMIHLHTDLGVSCLHRDAKAYLVREG